MSSTILRSAGVLRLEREKKEKTAKDSAYEFSMQRAVEEIEKAHKAGKRSVWCLTFPDAIVRDLEANGYIVKLHRASGCGDVDSHEIIW